MWLLAGAKLKGRTATFWQWQGQKDGNTPLQQQGQKDGNTPLQRQGQKGRWHVDKHTYALYTILIAFIRNSNTYREMRL